MEGILFSSAVPFGIEVGGEPSGLGSASSHVKCAV